MSHVAAVHLYVTDLDRSVDFYTKLLGYGPQAAYDEGENAHSREATANDPGLLYS